MLYLYIFIAGGLGSLSRYLISVISPFKFYFATMAVNFLGCFLIGILAAQLKAGHFKTAIIAGFLGGFTTFSAFGLDFIKLLDKAQYTEAAIYVVLTVALSLLAVFIGYNLAK